jgi:hypothetical protein
MIRTCKNHDSRVHNYWIHYMSLCILLKLAIWCVVQFQEVWVQNCLVTSCHFQASSHFCNQSTFNLLGLTNLNFACWSLIKIFCQNTIWNKYLLISKQQEDNEKTCFVEGWDVITKQKCNIAQQYDWQFIAIIESSFLAISVFCQTFSITCHSEDVRGQNDRWHHLSQTELDSWNSCICSIEMAEDPTMTSHLLSGLYHLENGGCMGFVGVR